MSADSNNDRRPGLGRIQRWMQTLVTQQGEGRAGTASEATGLDESRDTFEGLVLPSATLSAAERVDIYRRSYRARLLQSLQTMFPSLLRALGEELFNRFASDYLRQHPPHGYTLDRLADDFPRHLAETRPDADAPPARREQWPDFIVELATLELAFLKVFDGHGVEGRRLPAAPDIAALSDEGILAARPVPVPCLRLFAFSYPVHAYLLGARRGESPRLPAPAESFVCVTRRDYRVLMYELTSTQYEFMRALDGRLSVARALGQVSLSVEPPRPSVYAAREWLRDWAAKGLFERVEVPREAGERPYARAG
jgi:putative DNA-binding protein